MANVPAFETSARPKPASPRPPTPLSPAGLTGLGSTDVAWATKPEAECRVKRPYSAPSLKAAHGEAATYINPIAFISLTGTLSK